MPEDLSFRWLGVQGVEFSYQDSTLLVDPFFTRPSILRFFFRVASNEALAAKYTPRADFILVTHPHYDHIMDVPAIARRTGALVCGSPNSGAILALHGVPDRQFHELHPGQVVRLGPFEVHALPGLHPPLPLIGTFQGSIRPGLRPPLRPVDYVLDRMQGYAIQAGGLRILFCPAAPAEAADVLFASAQQQTATFPELLSAVRPRLFIPLHWENFFLPLTSPPVELRVPGRPGLQGLRRLLSCFSPETHMQVPEIFKGCNINRELHEFR